MQRVDERIAEIKYYINATQKKRGERMKIERNNENDGTVLVCAVRYCLGRQSYMPALVTGVLRPMLKDCPEKALRTIMHDITDDIDYAEKLNKSDEEYEFPYKKMWLNFQFAIATELDKRADERSKGEN